MYHTMKFVLIAMVLLTNPSPVTFAVQNPEPLRVTAIAWSPDGSLLAEGGGMLGCDPSNPDTSFLRIRDAATGAVIRELAADECIVRSLDWSPDGTKIVSGSDVAFGGTSVWDVATGQLEWAIARPTRGTTTVRWSPDGTRVAFSELSGLISFLDAATGAPMGAVFSAVGTAFDWSPDGSKLAVTRNVDESVLVVDISTTPEQVLELEGHGRFMDTVAWSSDGTKIASGDASADPMVRVWDANTGQALLTLGGHTTTITEVRWSPDGTRLASASGDGTVHVWDAATGDVLDIIQGGGPIFAIDWSPDGTQLAFGGTSATGEAVFEIVPAPQITTCDSTIPASDTAALIAAIDAANLSGVPTGICLTNSVYSFSPNPNQLFDADGDNALPSITGHVTIIGDGATITRGNNRDFRFFHVAAGGSLTLNDVTLSGDDPIRNHGRLIIDDNG